MVACYYEVPLLRYSNLHRNSSVVEIIRINKESKRCNNFGLFVKYGSVILFLTETRLTPEPVHSHSQTFF